MTELRGVVVIVFAVLGAAYVLVPSSKIPWWIDVPITGFCVGVAFTYLLRLFISLLSLIGIKLDLANEIRDKFKKD